MAIGVKRGLEENSDFDSSDDEYEPINKKQRVNDEYNYILNQFYFFMLSLMKF